MEAILAGAAGYGFMYALGYLLNRTTKRNKAAGLMTASGRWKR